MTVFRKTPFALLLVSASTTYAVEPNKATPSDAATTELEAVTIIGKSPKRTASSITVITAETLEASRVMTTSEALRKAGVNVRDEEGLGLRPNIGFRGLNPSRSTKTLLLEDGIPLAYAPYGDNASYYHPPIERFNRIEVLKGASQTQYGPQTVGGVVNYLTPMPTPDFSGGLSITQGTRSFNNVVGHLAGTTAGGIGLRADVVRKQGDGARDRTHSEIEDNTLKAVWESGAHRFTVRGNHYEEDSQVGYTGITDAELRNFGALYNPFEHDTFETQRTGFSFTHEWRQENKGLQTHVYQSSFERDWWRQSSTTTDNQCGAAFTAMRANGQAINPNACNSTQGRLRTYRMYGVEPRGRLSYDLWGSSQELVGGVRAHKEYQDRQQVNGSSANARSGVLAEDNRRETLAYSAFVQNTTRVAAFSITPGVRVEHIENYRQNRLNNASGSDTLVGVIPSLSLGWTAGQYTVFAGVHRGFTPPRTEDVLNNNGGGVDVEGDRSVNAEIGVRSRLADGVKVEATLFRNDFSTQVAVGSIAGGNTPLAQGESLYQGVELNTRLEAPKVAGFLPFMEAAWTYTETAEMRSPFRQVVGGAIVGGSKAGNRLPYAPEHVGSVTLGSQAQGRFGGFEGRVEAVYISEQFSDFANTETAPTNGNGQLGKIADSLLWNVALNWQLPKRPVTVFLAVKNLTDEADIVDRTRGILLTQPRLIQGGVQFNW
jgi:Fe(3+) dicitrate transport protein